MTKGQPWPSSSALHPCQRIIADSLVPPSCYRFQYEKLGEGPGMRIPFIFLLTKIKIFYMEMRLASYTYTSENLSMDTHVICHLPCYGHYVRSRMNNEAPECCLFWLLGPSLLYFLGAIVFRWIIGRLG